MQRVRQEVHAIKVWVCRVRGLRQILGAHEWNGGQVPCMETRFVCIFATRNITAIDSNAISRRIAPAQSATIAPAGVKLRETETGCASAPTPAAVATSMCSYSSCRGRSGLMRSGCDGRSTVGMITLAPYVSTSMLLFTRTAKIQSRSRNLATHLQGHRGHGSLPSCYGFQTGSSACRTGEKGLGSWRTFVVGASPLPAMII